MGNTGRQASRSEQRASGREIGSIREEACGGKRGSEGRRNMARTGEYGWAESNFYCNQLVLV